MRLASFVMYDTLGAGIWVGILTGIGYAFSDEIESLFGSAMKMGSLLGWFCWGLAAFLGWKYLQRQRSFRQVQMARIGPRS